MFKAKLILPNAVFRSVMAVIFPIPQNGPPLDSTKVARLRTAIAQGSYRIDPSDVADAMISFGDGSARQFSDSTEPSEN